MFCYGGRRLSAQTTKRPHRTQQHNNTPISCLKSNTFYPLLLRIVNNTLLLTIHYCFYFIILYYVFEEVAYLLNTTDSTNYHRDGVCSPPIATHRPNRTLYATPIPLVVKNGRT